MSNERNTPGGEMDAGRVGLLIERLAATERELHELLGDDADAVITARGETHLLRNAQKSLQLNEDVQRRAAALQRGILNALPACIALLDRQGRIVLVNEAWADPGKTNCFYGSGTGVGDHYLEACEQAAGDGSGKEREAVEGIRAVMSGETPRWQLEYTYDQGGRQRWLRLMATPLHDGDVQGAVVMHLDITEQMLAVEATRAGEQRLSKLLESAADAITLFDARGRFLYASPPTARLLGYDPETELVGRKALTFVHPEDRGDLLARLAEGSCHPGVGVLATARLRRKDGDWRQCEGIFTNLLGDPTLRAVVGNCRDVTERYQAHAAIEESAQRLHLATLMTGMGVWEWDIVTGRLVWDEQMFALYGFDTPPEEMNYGLWLRTVLPEDRDAQTAILWETVHRGERSERKFRIRRVNDGAIRIIHAAEITVNGDDGRVSRVVGVNRDVTDFEIAAENLAASEARFRQAFEFAGTGMAIVGLDGTWLKANRAICQIFGYTEEELAAKTFQELTHPDDLEADLAHVRDLLEEKDSYYQMEKRYFHRGGHVIWCRLNVSLVRDALGAPLHFVSQVENINERKLAEKALRESETLLVLAQQVAGFGSWEMEIDPEMKGFHPRMSWSEQFQRIFGLEPGSLEAGYETFIEMVHPEDRAALVKAFRKALREGTHFTAQHRIVHPDGAVRILHEEGRVFRDERNRAVKVVGGAHDITESESIEQERERLAVIVESSGDAIISHDPRGIVTSWNAAAERIYGYSRREMIGQGLARLFPTEKIAEEMAILDRMIHTREVAQYEAGRVRKDGKVIQVSVTLSPIINPAGQVVAVSKIVRDITERKEAEAALEAAQRRLVEASRQAGKAEVATNVLHNVGNVLNSVNISAEMIARSLRSDTAGKLARVAALLTEHAGDLPAYLSVDPQGKRIASYLGLLAKALRDDHASAQAETVSLRANIDHIRQIIAVQQDHSRYDASETISASGVLEDALRINAMALARHQVEVVREWTEDISLVADKHQIMQILVNLIHNAKEALKAVPAENRRLTLRLERAAARIVRFSVIDSGAGIIPEHLERLFEHGFTTRTNGHGFGLHSAALLAAELGGSLQASSPGAGLGATFTLEILHREQPLA